MVPSESADPVPSTETVRPSDAVDVVNEATGATLGALTVSVFYRCCDTATVVLPRHPKDRMLETWWQAVDV